METPVEYYTRRNQQAWDEIAHERAAKTLSVDDLRAGVSTLDAEVGAIGDVAGRRLLHLQCAAGDDTLSWAALGADVVGVDFSATATEQARERAAAAAIAAEFVTADVYELPDDLRQAGFDVVYTGHGALCWLPDLSRWAAVVASTLKTGGRLLLAEHHPLWDVLRFSGGDLRVVGDYFARSAPRARDDIWRLAGRAESGAVSYEFTWPLGDVVTALAENGLRVESIRESAAPDPAYWDADYFEGAPLPDRDALVAAGAERLPMSYILVAVKA